MGNYGTYDRQELPGRKATAPGALKDEQGNDLPSFDERHTESFKGLLYLGALTDRYSWLGHEFVIRTLGPDEQLAIALVVKDYVGTQGETMAYTAATAAMACISVDGQELPAPIGEDQRLADWAHARFSYVTKNWYGYTIAKCFEKYLELEGTASAVIEAMGKAFGSAAESTPGSNDTSA